MIRRRWLPYKEDVGFVGLLKSCAKEKDLQKGIKIHSNIREHYGCLEMSSYIANSLISMYAKCGDCSKAREVLEEIPTRSIVSWNALISGYTHQDQFYEALKCFEEIEHEGLFPDEITFICMLKCCGRTRAIEKGKWIHDEIMKSNQGLLDKHTHVGNALVDMYAKCGDLQKAREVLEKLPVRDVVSWNTLMEGYNHHGRGHKVVECFEKMRSENLSPDDVTFLSILKACASTKSIEKGEQIHDEIVRTGLLEKNVVVSTALVDMYAKFGMMDKAKEVLEGLLVHDVVSWNALITGYAQVGRHYEATMCLERMRNMGLSPDAITLLSILKACGCIEAIEKGKKVHNEVLSRGFLEKDTILGNALVVMYAKLGMLERAQRVLEELHVRNLVSWSAMIAGYEQQGQDHEAVKCFEQMKCEGFSPDAVTFISILKVCGKIGAIDKGEQIHEEILRRGLLGRDIVLSTALLDMYAKCGITAKAKELLEKLPVRDSVSWNALIAGYIKQRQVHEALQCLERMESEGLYPNVVTFISILKACGSIGDIDNGKRIHSEIESRGLLQKHVFLGTALVDMYAKFGFLPKAHEVLENLSIRNAVSWNALIAGCVEQGQAHEALNCFERMRSEGLAVDVATLISILKACGSVGALDKGIQIHYEISRMAHLENDISLQTALIDMYVKCDRLDQAHEVLENLPIRDVVAWSALITGYADRKQGYKAIGCFERMQNEGLFLDEVTFLCVLTACGRSGLLSEAEVVFANMIRKYGILPMKEHLTCMIMVLGCPGDFDKTMLVIKSMPCSHHSAVWIALLGACKKWGNVELGMLAFDQAIQLDHTCATAYVLMGDIFTLSGMQENAQNIETMRFKDAFSEEDQGNNVWVDVTGEFHSVFATKVTQGKGDIHTKVRGTATRILPICKWSTTWT